jgi:hypothetical protein
MHRKSVANFAINAIVLLLSVLAVVMRAYDRLLPVGMGQQ